VAVLVLLVFVLVVVLVYRPVTIEVETKSDSLFETLTVAFITGTKLSGVTATAAPLNMSWHVIGNVPMLVAFVTVQPTAVLTAAVAFELAVCATAAPVNSSEPSATPNNCLIWFLLGEKKEVRSKRVWQGRHC
jgi:hypothetical protein